MLTTVTTGSTVTVTDSGSKERAANTDKNNNNGNTVPTAVAGSCCNNDAYISACSCLGVAPETVTTCAPTTTVTSTATVNPTTTVTPCTTVVPCPTNTCPNGTYILSVDGDQTPVYFYFPASPDPANPSAYNVTGTYDQASAVKVSINAADGSVQALSGSAPYTYGYYYTVSESTTNSSEVVFTKECTDAGLTKLWCELNCETYALSCADSAGNALGFYSCADYLYVAPFGTPAKEVCPVGEDAGTFTVTAIEA